MKQMNYFHHYNGRIENIVKHLFGFLTIKFIPNTKSILKKENNAVFN